MEPLLSDHNGALSVVCGTSLILGLPLIVNTLWHLRVSSNASGRGVLRNHPHETSPMGGGREGLLNVDLVKVVVWNLLY